MEESHKESHQTFPQILLPLEPTELLSPCTMKLSKTKKICTLGPKSSSVEEILMLIDNGVNVARLNFSHGTHESHLKYLNTVKQALKQRPSKHMSVLLDTKGPEIRTGKNKDGNTITLEKFQQLQITTDYNHLSTKQCISCSYKDLATSVKIGSIILFADGKISAEVTRINKSSQHHSVTVKVFNDGEMGEKKNMCLPGLEVNLPTINDYDEHDILEFGLKHRVDYIAISFARFGKDLDYVRQIIGKKDKYFAQRVQLISKIENHQAIQNLEEIIKASDGIMVARGDLGMETPLEKVVLIQKLMSSMTINQGKTLIVATQMLQSMESKPRPTRAEISDITNAVLDLADATMTSGETANGQFPEQTVGYMRKVSLEAERVCNYQEIFKHRVQRIQIDLTIKDVIEVSFEKRSDVICIQTDDSGLARMVSSARPSAYVFVFTDIEQVKTSTALNYGVYCFGRDMFFNLNGLFSQHRQAFGFQKKLKILTLESKSGNFQTHFKELQLLH